MSGASGHVRATRVRVRHRAHWQVRLDRSARPRLRPTGSDGQYLLAVVLTAVRAHRVRQLGLTAGAIRADRERWSGRLPLRAASPGVAARHLPLRNGHGTYSSMSKLGSVRSDELAPSLEPRP